MIIAEEIKVQCEIIGNMLVTKNAAYGNSVFEPIGIFAKTDWENQIYTRIDDKLSRVSRGSEYPGDDTILDLIGYLILLRVGRKLYAKEYFTNSDSKHPSLIQPERKV